jgi:acetylornithine deacetylase/succinyl-diaminopimelate desuccinylase-like protein
MRSSACGRLLDDALFHGEDERIPVDGFLWGLRVLYRVVRGFCT